MGIVRDYALYAYLTARLININKCPRAMRGCNDTLSCAFFLFLFFFLLLFLLSCSVLSTMFLSFLILKISSLPSRSLSAGNCRSGFLRQKASFNSRENQKILIPDFSISISSTSTELDARCPVRMTDLNARPFD